MKPRIFVSTVTSEFRAARTKIEHVLEFLGYEVVQQDIFGVEPGDLRQVLRDKIDSCDALLQLVGDAYGAEPPAPDADFGRVSYTQFEFLHARKMGKKTYVLFAGPGCKKDTPVEKLDPANQAELRDLQAAYRATLRTGGHLWHHPADDTALENSVLRLRDDSEQLRKEFKDWQKTLTRGQARNSRGLLAIAALILLLGAGGWYAHHSTQRKLTTLAQPPKPLDKSRLREHLTTASEKALARDLAEAEAIQGDWEKRQKLTDAAQAAHQQRLSRVTELADEFATLETGENASTTLSEMLRILDEQGIDQALGYLSSRGDALLEKAIAKAGSARNDLQPLLTGAQLALANGQHEKAEALFLQLVSPEIVFWPEARHQYFEYLVETKGPRQETHATIATAHATYLEAQRQATLLTLQDPAAVEWQRDLSISHSKLADVARSEGDLEAARTSYTNALEIAQTLSARDPGNRRWQRDLSVTYNNLGDIAHSEGDLDAARASYMADLRITEALTATDPGNQERMRDLSVCHMKLGDIARAAGDFAAARASYTKALDISESLAARDPGNATWQRDLSVCHGMLGAIARSEDDFAAARAYYTAALGISESLAAGDPANAERQRDLSITHEKMGDLALAEGNAASAGSSHSAALEIRLRLAARDPDNARWQRDLAVSHCNLADVAKAEGNEAEEHGHLRQALSLFDKLLAAGRHVSPEDMQFIAEIRSKVGVQ